MQFPTLGFLARQIFGDSRLLNRNERVFSITGVFTALLHCRLGSKNLAHLVILVKTGQTIHVLVAKHSLWNNLEQKKKSS